MMIEIPLNQLARSPNNVRKTASTGIGALAVNIDREGLLQNLVVTEAPGGAGKVTHLVEAGGRRLEALQLLVDMGKIPEDYPIPCEVVDQARAEAVSLAENQMREPMHPVDQIEAFKARVDAGESVAEVSNRYGVTETFVKQRLKLATVSPVLLAESRAGNITLEQLQALSVTDDHGRQESLWEQVKDDQWDSEPEAIRHELLNNAVTTDDPRLKFIGRAAYIKAGGAIIAPDLFTEAEAGREAFEHVSDLALLQRLATAKLVKMADKLQAEEKLAWVDVMTVPFNRYGVTTIVPATTVRGEASAEVAERLRELEQKREELCRKQDLAIDEERYDDHDELCHQEALIEEQIEQIEESLAQPHPDEVEHLGAVISIQRNGKAEITRNLIRVEHRAKSKHPGVSSDNTGAATEPTQQPAGKYSERLCRMLTAHKTAILRLQIANHSASALATLVYDMLVDRYGNDLQVHDRCLTLNKDWRATDIEAVDESVENSSAIGEFNALVSDMLDGIRGWLDSKQEQYSSRAEALHSYLLFQGVGRQLEILAVVVATHVDLVVGQPEAHGISHGAAGWYMEDEITRVWWQPTADSFFGHLSKAQIIDEITDAWDAETASKLAAMKKGEAADEAETLVANTKWLPKIMRADVEGE